MLKDKTIKNSKYYLLLNKVNKILTMLSLYRQAYKIKIMIIKIQCLKVLLFIKDLNYYLKK